MSVSLIPLSDILLMAGGADRNQPNAEGVHGSVWEVAPPLGLMNTYKKDDSGIITIGWSAARRVGLDLRERPVYELKPLMEGRFRPYNAPAWAAAHADTTAPVPEGSYRYIGGSMDLTRDYADLSEFVLFKEQHSRVRERLRDFHSMTTALADGPYTIPSVSYALDPARLASESIHDRRELVRAAQSVMRGYLEHYFPHDWISDARAMSAAYRDVPLDVQLPPRPEMIAAQNTNDTRVVPLFGRRP